MADQNTMDQKNVLGQGAFGQILRDPLRPGYVIKTTLWPMAQKEHRVAQRLGAHPNVVHVDLSPHALVKLTPAETVPECLVHGQGRLWLGEWGMDLFAAMETKYLASREDLVADRMAITTQLFDAMRHIHGCNVAHMDLKLENVLVKALPNGTLGVQVCDFGLCSESADHYARHTRAMRGSFAYLAPEILRGLPCNPFELDIWAVGVVVYSLHAGYFPFNVASTDRCKDYLEFWKEQSRGVSPFDACDRRWGKRLNLAQFPPYFKATLDTCLCVDPGARKRFSIPVADLPTSALARMALSCLCD